LEDVKSFLSYPAIMLKRYAASSTVLTIGPGESKDEPIASTPYLDTLEYVGLRPTIPHHDAGSLMEPAVSVPTEAVHISAATAAAEPPLDPPGRVSVSQGFLVGP